MKTQHTPAPWSIVSNKIDGNGHHLASINASATAEGRANARLISTAPELLELLVNFSNVMHICNDTPSASAHTNHGMQLVVNRARTLVNFVIGAAL